MKEWHGDDIEAEDVVLEAENNEPQGGSDCEKKVAKLKADLEKTTSEKQEYMDGWQRAKADYVNLLKRFETETKSSELRGRVGAVETLLPAFDALERSKEHGEVPEGFVAITKQLESAFKALGLEEVGVVGEKFDPAFHEALGQDPTDEKAKDDTITVVLERGWRIGSSVTLRPAKVRVAHFG